MAVVLEQTRFGTFSIPSEAVLAFPSGLIGLSGSRYAVLARSEQSIFFWLQSLDDPDLAVPLADPWRFFDDFTLRISSEDLERTGIARADQVSVYVIVRAEAPFADSSVNLRAPVVVVDGKGWQIINQAQDATVRAALFPSGLNQEERRPDGPSHVQGGSPTCSSLPGDPASG